MKRMRGQRGAKRQVRRMELRRTEGGKKSSRIARHAGII